MGFKIPEFIPPGVNVNLHMKLAYDQWNKDPLKWQFMSWFYYRVRNRGVWDYKQEDSAWENYGNFHYGAVGTAGQLPEGILLRAAGYAQKRAGSQSVVEDWGKWYMDPPYGDDPTDQDWIEEGIEYAKAMGY
ncbi:polymorphic toxin type 44 domain-containing protein [Pseudomonas syringae]|uniref:polymorphic toxin type 44 domain-containing protein n=1 Tax=Pseudomonas syringae TaxID=317 RepID=UPI0004665D38|nr:polymorphic toxin type 44 domain-containing protein [Pseudomonas syringae]